MQPIIQKFLVFSLFIGIALNGRSQTIEFTQNFPGDKIGQSLYLLTDEHGNLSIDQVAGSIDFRKSESVVPNLGVTTNVHWVRFAIQNNSSEDRFLIDIQQPSLDFVEFFYPNSDSTYSSKILADSIPLNERPIAHQNYTFVANQKTSTTSVYYLKVRSGDQIQLPIVLGNETTINKSHNRSDLLFGLFSGIMIALLMYNFFIYISTKERNYLLYVLYIGMVYLTQANVQGYTLRLFLSDLPNLERYAVFVLSGIVPFTGVLFMISFLQLRERIPKTVKFFYSILGIYVVAITLGLTGNFQPGYNLLQGCAGTLALSQLAVAIALAVRKVPNAANFLVAWSVFLVGVIVFVLKDFEVVPFNDLTFNMMSIGSAMESILLSLALATRINQLKKEKELSQHAMLEALKENQAIVENQNEVLEQKVHERTEALEKSNADLNETLRNLKLAQSQLIEAEKLASLGQMTAGIAHELNNPINFVSSNVSPLKRDVYELIELLNDYGKLNGEADYHTRLASIREKHKTVDVELLRNEVDTLLSGINEGAARTAEIVRGLRVFSRTDRDTPVNANVNECVLSALIVMKSMIKREVVIVKELDSSLPDMHCFPGKLTQVFMNLLSNAIHATKNSGLSADERLIRIHSWFNEKEIFVSVHDNGSGMNEMIRSKIFEPFFTTKQVGEGTGLGLSIVAGIINEHKGTIEVHSTPVGGTEFRITLPRNPW